MIDLWPSMTGLSVKREPGESEFKKRKTGDDAGGPKKNLRQRGADEDD